MVTQQHPEQTGGQASPGLPASTDIVLVDGKEPTPPKELSDTEAQELRERAVALVAQLAEAGGSRQMELADSITTLGNMAQRRAGSELNLLRGRVSETFTKDSGADITKDLVELRLALNEISPREAGFIRRVLSMLPFVSDPALKALERIALRYEPASKQVEIIESRLRGGRAMLVRDNIELRKLYEQVEEQQVPIKKNAYLGELVMRELNALLERSDDEVKNERVRIVLHDVSIRVQDLRTMEMVYTQFFVSTEMTRQNNSRLGQSVERTLALGTNVVMIGLAIQAALINSERVRKANERMREFLGDLITTNSGTVLQHTQAIGDAYNNPVIALEKIAQAQHDLIEAMDIAERLKLDGIESARQNIAKLSALTAEMEKRSAGLRDDVQDTVEA